MNPTINSVPCGHQHVFTSEVEEHDLLEKMVPGTRSYHSSLCLAAILSK